MQRLLMAFLIVLATLPAGAGEAEIRAAQSSITAQLDAFRSGDDARAYSYAAPNIRQMFPTLDRFMAMVRRGYQPVYQPRNYGFGTAEELKDGTIRQRVFTTGADGKSYEAVYTLRRQPDGTYRITGVSLKEAAALAI